MYVAASEFTCGIRKSNSIAFLLEAIHAVRIYIVSFA